MPIIDTDKRLNFTTENRTKSFSGSNNMCTYNNYVNAKEKYG